MVELGFTEGAGRAHAGQGTANRRFFFVNAMFECLWMTDEADLKSRAIRQTRLWERFNGEALPFGVCIRPMTRGAKAPFESWVYRPPYLPDGVGIHVAHHTPLTEPMWFYVDVAPPENESPSHANGARRLSSVCIRGPGLDTTSAAARQLIDRNLVSLRVAERPALQVEFDDRAQQESADLRPELPLLLRW